MVPNTYSRAKHQQDLVSVIIAGEAFDAAGGEVSCSAFQPGEKLALVVKHHGIDIEKAGEASA